MSQEKPLASPPAKAPVEAECLEGLLLLGHQPSGRLRSRAESFGISLFAHGTSYRASGSSAYFGAS